jgi:hypothetical protein
MSQTGKSMPAPNPLKAGRIALLAGRAGRLAEKNRKKGYH